MSNLKIITPLSLSQLLETDAESELNAFIEQNIAQNKCLTAQEINNFSIYWQTDMDDSKKLVTKSHLIQKQNYSEHRYTFFIEKSYSNIVDISLPARSLNIKLFYNHENLTPQYTIPANFKCNVYLRFQSSVDPETGEIIYDEQIYAFGLQFKCVKNSVYYFKIADYFESCWENDKNNYEGYDKPKTPESVKNYFNYFFGYSNYNYSYDDEINMEEIINSSRIYKITNNDFELTSDTIYDIVGWDYEMSYGNYDQTKILLDPSEIFNSAKIASYTYPNDSSEDIATFYNGVYLPHIDLENTEFIEYSVSVYIPEPFDINVIDTLDLVITPTIEIPDDSTDIPVFISLKNASNNAIILGPIDENEDYRRYYVYYIDEGDEMSGSTTAIRINNIPLTRFNDDFLGCKCTIKTGVEIGDGDRLGVTRNWGLRTMDGNRDGANYITDTNL